jgi:hypothetical protein
MLKNSLDSLSLTGSNKLHRKWRGLNDWSKHKYEHGMGIRCSVKEYLSKSRSKNLNTGIH